MAQKRLFLEPREGQTVFISQLLQEPEYWPGPRGSTLRHVKKKIVRPVKIANDVLSRVRKL